LTKKDWIIRARDEEIRQLNLGIYELEILKEKFSQKDVEVENLLLRVGNIARENENLKVDISLYD